jgi:hypothetical protein
MAEVTYDKEITGLVVIDINIPKHSETFRNIPNYATNVVTHRKVVQAISR